MITIKDIKDTHIFDTCGKTKKGTYIGRTSYFYTMSKSQDTIADNLMQKFPTIKIVDKGNHWAAFKGDQSIKAGSHFWVEFIIEA